MFDFTRAKRACRESVMKISSDDDDDDGDYDKRENICLIFFQL
jgi:hypothetical protein